MAHDLTFVHFSDTHIVRPGARVRDVDTCQTLQRVVEAVNRLEPPPAFVIIGGDLASPDLDPEVKRGVRDVTANDYERAYAVFHELIGSLAVPVHMLMGNHDRRIPFRRVVRGESDPRDEPLHYVVDAEGYRLCVLDSLDTGKNPGRLGDGQLAWLRDRLLEARHHHALVAVHHHAVPVGVRWLDEQMLLDADGFWRVVREARNVRAVLCGHVHLEHEAVRDGVPVFTTPSTCFQISKESQDRRYLVGPPSFRLVSCSRGTIVSNVRWL